MSTDLPVKLEELLQFSFNFSNLIKIIDYLHKNNLSLQNYLKDMDKRLTSLEYLKNDIDDLKIKTENIEKTNENLNHSFMNLQERILKYDSKIAEIQSKTKEIEENEKKIDSIQISHEQNINHLNKVVEDNVKTCNKLNNIININNNNMTLMMEKLENFEKKDKENYEDMNKNINEINSHYELDHKEIENINNNISEINESIKNITNNFEKKNSDMNNRIMNIVNEIADINNNIINNINTNKVQVKKPNKYSKEATVNITTSINNDINSNNLFKIAMDEIEEGKNNFNKLKEDYEAYKDKQSKENNSFQKNIDQLSEKYNDLKTSIEDNVEKTENIEINFNEYINLQKEEKEKNEENERKNKEEEMELNKLPDIQNKFVKIDKFKKLSDNVRILTSTMNSKPGREEVETQLKKLNQRLENVEMIQQGQTHGPRTRINLGLVNIPISRTDSSINSEEQGGEMNEFDILVKKIEKNISSNTTNLINKQIENLDLTLNPKINELINNYNKTCEDIEKNNKSIIDIRNILLTNPTHNEIAKIKSDIEIIDEIARVNKIKIFELTKSIEGTDNDEDEENKNELPGTVNEKFKFLNRTCQTLNLKLVSLENKHKSINKEVKDEIKQNLKNETSKIMQQFKQRLESFTNRFEHELKNKIDQMGLSEFETKINNKFHVDLREKLDKNELKKNNNVIKRKIDNLENKISKTLVDTIIDLQMDDQPLIIKKNGNGVDVCASCNQPLSRNNIIPTGDFLTGNISNLNMSRKNINRSLINFTQPSSMKSVINNSEKSFNNSNLGNNKLPDIIPSVHPK